MRLGVLLCLLLTLPAVAAESAEKLFERARNVNPKLVDYSADIAIQLNATLGFIPYRPNLAGRYYHKRPDKHKLDLQNAPSYLKKYPSVFGFNLPDLKRYNAIRVQETDLRGVPVYKVMLVPKVKTSDITAIDVYLNRSDFSVPKYDTFYTKGHLFVNIDFKRQDGYLLYDRMTAEFEFPSITATANASYSNYQINQNLPDALFKS
jgi:hypothetical protein